MEPSADTPRAKPAARPGRAARPPWSRRADWTVGIAAGVLLVISLSGWLYHRVQLADIAAEHLRLRVTGPARLRAGMATEYEVTTTSVTGQPIQAQVDFAVYSAAGKQLVAHNEKTDERDGRLTVTLPADLEVGGGVKMRLAASHGQQREEVVTLVAVEPVRHAAYVSPAKQVYRPGETVHYRALVLSRFALTADREMRVRFEILDPGGSPVPKSQAEAVTRRGVARGQFRIPEDLPGGEYTLMIRSVGGEFPEERRAFFIRHGLPPRLKLDLRFDRAGYGPGGTVSADFSARFPDGAPAAAVPLRIYARMDRERVHDEQANTSDTGTFRIEFKLPEEIEGGDARLFVVADDGAARETAAWEIPLRTGPIDVRFYPEGGYLVADLENRVYFTARNSLGEPVDLTGTILNGQGQMVARANTTHAGMGMFSIHPQPGEEYRLEHAGTDDRQSMPRLPGVSTTHDVVLSMGLGVFGAERPLEFNVRASEAGLPLVASAWCRGVPVGQQLFVTGEKDSANPVAVALHPGAAGVIRLSVYDYGASPPEPVAERLLYRRPAFSSEDGQSEDEDTEDETPRDAAPMDETPPEWLAHFLLATEIDGEQDVDLAGTYLSGGGEANAALDLLLGVQGWRRFMEQPREKPPGEEVAGDRPARMAALGGGVHPPAMFDNLIELQERYRESLAAFRARRTRTSNTLTTVSFLGGAGLVLLVAMLNLLNIAGGPRIWATAIAAATISLIVGGILMDPGRWKTAPEGAVAFVPFDMAPEEIAGDEESNRDDAVEKTQRTETGPPQFGAPFDFDDHETRDSGKGQSDPPPPLELEAKMPSAVGPGDRINLPLAVINGAGEALSVDVVVEHDESVQLDGKPREAIELPPGERARLHFPFSVGNQEGPCKLAFRGTAGGRTAEVGCTIDVEADARGAASGEGGDQPTRPVQLSTRLTDEKVVWGDDVGLVAELLNTSDAPQPMTVAVLGLPAGCEPRPHQLRRLRQAGRIDYYQTHPRELIFYWHSLDPKEKIELKLDLIAAVPGRYSGPASRVYLYDSPERSRWNDPLVVEITRE